MTITQQPAMVSRKELWRTFAAIAIILVAIAALVSVDISKSGPPAKEIYIFPTNTYVCTNDEVDGGAIERVCALKGASPTAISIPTSATLGTSSRTEQSLQTEVTK